MYIILYNIYIYVYLVTVNRPPGVRGSPRAPRSLPPLPAYAALRNLAQRPYYHGPTPRQVGVCSV